MKLSFSTLACPDWTLSEITAAAKDLGYDGVEIRGLGDEMYAPKLKIFDTDNIDKTQKKFRDLKLTIPILSSGASLGLYTQKDCAPTESADYIALAHKLGVKYVRVLFTHDAYPDGGDKELFKSAYSKLCAQSAKFGVTPLIETSGMLSDTKLLKKLIGGIDTDNKGVLWDVNHTARYNNESVDTTLANIGQYIMHVHLKDSLIEKGKPAYKMLGFGDIPVKEAVKKLKASGYNGYYSLEWVKRWHSDLQEAGIVLSHFIETIKTY